MAVLYEHHCNRARILGFLALIGCAIAGLHYFSTEPILALAGGVALIQAGYFLVDMPPCPAQGKELEDNQYTLAVVRNGLYALLGLAPLSFFLNPNHLVLGEQAVAVAVLFAQFFIGLHLKNTATSKKSPWWWLLPAILSGGTFLAIRAQLTALAAVISSLLTLLILPASQKGLVEHREKWWEPFLNHPARALITTFFALCLLGTLLLQLPWSATGQQLSFINAAFTSVSAVCVTGLTVVDTQLDFTVFGQVCLLLLIQLGGLGIMTITTVALHALGKRLSLRQERLLTTLTETSHQELIHSLVTIVKFTLIIETIGALLLACGFFLSGSSWSNALWKGVFTSVSAFCNAGFALDASNLLPYQHQPLILYPVSVLIIFGGLAPSTCILVPRWIRGRRIDLAPRVALVTTATLLGIGACSFLVFEWDHALDGLSFADKLTNAWFQSVTLRTAGFNSVDLSGVLSPTLLVMLFSMFIGGSPGGHGRRHQDDHPGYPRSDLLGNHHRPEFGDRPEQTYSANHYQPDHYCIFCRRNRLADRGSGTGPHPRKSRPAN